MKRDGSILIFVLLSFTLITAAGLAAIYMSSEQIEIGNNSIKKIQSQYLAESKINKVVYDERYYKQQLLPTIMDHSGEVNATYTLDESDIFLDDDNNIVKGKVYNLDGKRQLELSTTSVYEGINTSMKAYGTVFNDIFNEKNPALSYNTIKEEHLDRLNIFIDGVSDVDLTALPSRIEGIELSGYETVRIENVKPNDVANYNIITRTIIFDHEDEEVIEETIYKTLNNSRINFILVRNQSPNNKARFHIDDNVYFRGILYVEGDLVISSYFHFLGVIIVKGNIIIDGNLQIKPRIDGALLYNGDLDLSNWDLRHLINNITLYGIYLPNIIEPKLEIYRFTEGN